jgi:lipoprotein signal peptidase
LPSLFFKKGLGVFSWYFFLFFFPLIAETVFRRIFLDFSRSNYFSEQSTLICNKGLAFGIDFNFNLILFFNFFILVTLLFYAWKVAGPSKKKSLLFLLLGASFSNFVDRISLGCVVDYIDLGLWPTFNIADTFIVISLSLLFILYNRKVF